MLSASCVKTSGQNSKLVEQQSRAALNNAEANIEKYRKGDATIRLEKFAGRDVTVKIRQLSHDFKFGCYLKIDGLDKQQTALYESYFKRLFNYAVVGTFWDVTENKRGEHFWPNFENELAMARRNGWRVQAAPLIWGTNQAGTPKWLPRKRDELAGVVNSRISRFFINYNDRVDDVEVVNESLTPEPDVFAKTLGADYVREAFVEARKSAPNARLMLNDFGVFGVTEPNSKNRDRYFELIDGLVKKGAPIDVVGIQAHNNREWLSPADVAAQLERYATLGKPIQISEFSAQTKNYDDRKSFERITGNYREGVWDDAKQAEFYREFYMIAFGNPSVEAIVQWGLDDTRAWLPGIGVIGENLKPKANFDVLDELINRTWRTNLELHTKGASFTEFRGFFGLYEIEVTTADGKVLAKETMEIRRDSKNELVLR